MAARVRPFARYFCKGNKRKCVTPLTTHLAVTCRHGDNNTLKEGDEVEVRAWDNAAFSVMARVVRIIDDLDAIILRSDGAALCDENLLFEASVPRMGLEYLMVCFCNKMLTI